jgi:hypothetical protein
MGETVVQIDDALVHVTLPWNDWRLTRQRQELFPPDYFPADFGSATIISSSTRAPGELS